MKGNYQEPIKNERKRNFILTVAYYACKFEMKFYVFYELNEIILTKLNIFN